MALKPCPECGKPISEHARRCPHCGIDITTSKQDGQEMQDAPAPDLESKDYIGEEETPQPGNRCKLWVWIAVAIVIVGVLAGGGIYYSNQKKAQAEVLRQQQELDSIAAAEKTMTENLRKDSIARMEFADKFVDVNTFIERKAMDWGDGRKLRIPEFKENIVDRLEELGYKKTDTRRGTREGEGGYDNYAIYTFEKKYEDAADSDLWSKVVFDDGSCGGYTVYFCNSEQMDRFVKSCKVLGYARTSENGSNYLMIPNDTGMDYDIYHENWNCVIELGDNKVVLSFGCI